MQSSSISVSLLAQKSNSYMYLYMDSVPWTSFLLLEMIYFPGLENLNEKTIELLPLRHHAM